MVHGRIENLKAQKPDQPFRSEALLDKQRNVMRTMKNRICYNYEHIAKDDMKLIYSRIKYVNSSVKNISHQEALHSVKTEALFEEIQTVPAEWKSS